MVDFLFALGQVLCILGLLYGAYLSFTYRQEDSDKSASAVPVCADPVTAHVREVAAGTPKHGPRRVREDQGITVSSDRDDKGTAVRLHSRAELLIALMALLLPGGSLVLGAYWVYARLSSKMSKPK